MTARPRLLDLFCGQGGTSMGYHRAGFDVVGVDNRPQPRYPFEHHVADALTFPLDGFDALAASPPCQDHSAIRRATGKDHGTGWMLARTVERFETAGRPYVVENVSGADLPGAFTICGRAMGIARLKRHRKFRANFPVMVPPCACGKASPIGVFGDLRVADRRTSVKGAPRMRAGVDTARELIGAPWMDAAGLSQAIPPAYTEHIGGFLLDHLRAGAVAS
jgi:DNA (cytosine-5)-methyltransferase 1